MSQNSPSDTIQAWVAAAKNKDAASMAALYTTDAVLCATEGIISGQNNIQADFGSQFTNGWVLNGISNETDNVQTNWGWSVGNWSGSYAGTDVTGYWSVVWVVENNKWMIKQNSIITVPPQQ